jgi:hypothetical protein
VNFSALLEKLADFLKVQIEQVKDWMLDDTSPLKGAKKSKYKSENAPTLSEPPSDSEVRPLTSFNWDIPKDAPDVDNSPKLGNWTAKEGWNLVKSHLEMIMDRGSYETFIKRTKYADFLAESNTLVITAPNKYECEMPSGRLFPRMQRTVIDYIGSEYNVQFVTRSTG